MGLERKVAAVMVGVPAAWLVYQHGGSVLRSLLGIDDVPTADPPTTSSGQVALADGDGHGDTGVGSDADVEIRPALAGVPRDLAAVVQAYLRYDPRSTTRQSIQKVIGACSDAECTALHELFLPRIAFGTAGLRARMAPG
jgi:hypothetical protein